MSRFLSKRYTNMSPYIPGEQPKDKAYIKLNANETSCPPSPAVLEVLRSERMKHLGFYTDPASTELKAAVAEHYDVNVSNVTVGNGSDEILALIFLAFFEGERICFPDITYSFYDTLAKSFNIDHKEIKLDKDFQIDVRDYMKTSRHVVMPNPNAPTGYVLPVSEIERILAVRPDRLVVIDEAYVDFGNDSCIRLINKYDNLLVVHTMSKSRNLAGAHIGYCVGCEALIKDLEAMRSVINPFNVSDVTLAIGTAAMKDTEYLKKSTDAVIAAREYTATELEKMGFYVMESHTNFIFVTSPWISAVDYQAHLKNCGILTRHYKSPRISNFLRITIGTMAEMQKVVEATKSLVMYKAA